MHSKKRRIIYESKFACVTYGAVLHYKLLDITCIYALSPVVSRTQCSFHFRNFALESHVDAARVDFEYCVIRVKLSKIFGAIH